MAQLVALPPCDFRAVWRAFLGRLWLRVDDRRLDHDDILLALQACLACQEELLFFAKAVLRSTVLLEKWGTDPPALSEHRAFQFASGSIALFGGLAFQEISIDEGWKAVKHCVRQAVLSGDCLFTLEVMGRRFLVGAPESVQDAVAVVGPSRASRNTVIPDTFGVADNQQHFWLGQTSITAEFSSLAGSASASTGTGAKCLSLKSGPKNISDEGRVSTMSWLGVWNIVDFGNSSSSSPPYTRPSSVSCHSVVSKCSSGKIEVHFVFPCPSPPCLIRPDSSVGSKTEENTPTKFQELVSSATAELHSVFSDVFVDMQQFSTTSRSVYPTSASLRSILRKRGITARSLPLFLVEEDERTIGQKAAESRAEPRSLLPFIWRTVIAADIACSSVKGLLRDRCCYNDFLDHAIVLLVGERAATRIVDPANLATLRLALGLRFVHAFSMATLSATASAVAAERIVYREIEKSVVSDTQLVARIQTAVSEVFALCADAPLAVCAGFAHHFDIQCGTIDKFLSLGRESAVAPPTQMRAAVAALFPELVLRHTFRVQSPISPVFLHAFVRRIASSVSPRPSNIKGISTDSVQDIILREVSGFTSASGAGVIQKDRFVAEKSMSGESQRTGDQQSPCRNDSMLGGVFDSRFLVANLRFYTAHLCAHLRGSVATVGRIGSLLGITLELLARNEEDRMSMRAEWTDGGQICVLPQNSAVPRANSMHIDGRAVSSTTEQADGGLASLFTRPAVPAE